MIQTREELIKELEDYPIELPPYKAQEIADFILQDRKRIVEPLVEAKNSKIKFQSWERACELCHKAMNETLKRAGIEV